MIFNREAFTKENVAEVFLTHPFGNFFYSHDGNWTLLHGDDPENLLFIEVKETYDGWFVVTEEEVIIEAVWL